MSKLLNLAISGLFAAWSLSAQTVWTANATTAVPEFQNSGLVKTTTVDVNAHGRGVQPRTTVEGSGQSRLYIPVTAPNQTKFGCIGLRAQDSSTTGSIRAEFVRQPRNGNPAGAVTLGSVSSNDTGFQFVVAPFAVQVIDYNQFTYYIRLTFVYQSPATAFVPPPIAFDLSLSANCG